MKTQRYQPYSINSPITVRSSISTEAYTSKNKYSGVELGKAYNPSIVSPFCSNKTRYQMILEFTMGATTTPIKYPKRMSKTFIQTAETSTVMGGGGIQKFTPLKSNNKIERLESRQALSPEYSSRPIMKFRDVKDHVRIILSDKKLDFVDRDGETEQRAQAKQLTPSHKIKQLLDFGQSHQKPTHYRGSMSQIIRYTVGSEFMKCFDQNSVKKPKTYRNSESQERL